MLHNKATGTDRLLISVLPDIWSASESDEHVRAKWCCHITSQ